jgi:hypothetical protein
MYGRGTGSSGTGNYEELSQITYKTSMIRLKPEYELYDCILGKPKRENNEFYNELIIKDISKLLSDDRINYNKIKDIIVKKYHLEIET